MTSFKLVSHTSQSASSSLQLWKTAAAKNRDYNIPSHAILRNTPFWAGVLFRILQAVERLIARRTSFQLLSRWGSSVYCRPLGGQSCAPVPVQLYKQQQMRCALKAYTNYGSRLHVRCGLHGPRCKWLSNSASLSYGHWEWYTPIEWESSTSEIQTVLVAVLWKFSRLKIGMTTFWV